MSQKVLILGASGKIGTHSADVFWNAGWEVHRYNRGTDMNAAAMGMDVIVNGMNPAKYHDWDNQIPAITKQVIAAAKASGASVIIPGNVYNFGDAPGDWDENTPQNPTVRKGRIRVEMEQAYRDADVQTIIQRAGNFIDPNRDGDVLSMVMLAGMAKGKLTTVGAEDVVQTYAYLPDWARAAEKLAGMRDQLDKFEDVPFPGHAFSTSELKHELEQCLGRSVKVRKFPWWFMRLSSPVWEVARELYEMRYLFETSHRLGRTKFDRLLPGFVETELREALLSALPENVHPNQSVRASSKAVLAE